MRRAWSRRWDATCAVVVVAALSLLPASAWAIPSPEVVISSASAFGWVLAGALALLGIGAGLPRGTRQSGMRAALPLVAVVALVGALVAVDRLGIEREARRVEHEFRCDFGYHDQRREARDDWDDVMATGRVGFVPLAGWGAGADSALWHMVALDLRLPLWFESGHPVVPARGVVPRQIHLGELHEALEAGLSQARSVGKPALLLLVSQRPNPLMYFRDDERRRVAASLASYDRVEVAMAIAHDPADPFLGGATWALGDTAGLAHGDALALAQPGRRVTWPVLEEGMLVDAPAVWQRAFDLRLSERDAARWLDDPEMHVVVAFASWYRPAATWLPEFVGPLLRGIPRDRVHALDASSPTYRTERAALAERLRGQRWMLVGGSKFDVLHYGFDAVHAVGPNVAADGFVGWNADLGAVAALRAVRHEARRSALPVTLVRAVDARWGAWAREHAPRPGFWALWGVAWALVLAPWEWWLAAATRRERAARDAVDAIGPLHRRLARATVAGALAHGRRAGWDATAAVVTLVGGVLIVASATAFSATWLPGAVGDAWIAWCVVAAGTLVRDAGLATGGALRMGRTWARGVALAAGVAWLVSWLPEPAAWALAGAAMVRALLAWAQGGPMRGAPVAPPRDWDKAAGLEFAAKALAALRVRVPAWVVVDGAVDADAVKRTLGPGPWIVRSCAVGEDSENASHAGAWLSVAGVDASGIAEAVARVRASYGPEGGARVIVQRQVAAAREVVVFTECPRTPFVLRVETSRSAGGVVGGGGSDVETWTLSRWTGRWSPEPNRRDGAWLDAVAFAALRMSDAAARPLDVEAVLDAGGVVWVVQARPATAAEAASADAEERGALLAALEGARGPLALVPTGWAEGMERVAVPTVTWMRSVQAARGAALPVIWNRAVWAVPEGERGLDAILRRLRGPRWPVDGRGLARASAALAAVRVQALTVDAADDNVTEATARCALDVAAWTERAIQHRVRGRDAALPSEGVPAWIDATSAGVRAMTSAGQGAWSYRPGTGELEVVGETTWRPSGGAADPLEAARGGASSRMAESTGMGSDAVNEARWSVRVSVLRDAAHDTLALAAARVRVRVADEAISVDGSACGGADDASVRWVEVGTRPWTVAQLDAATAQVAAPMVGALRAFAGWGVALLADGSHATGEVGGEARVLVTERLDPAWLAVLAEPGWSGWVSGRGSLLAHAAIVARERGIPVCVLAAAEAPDALDGVWIEVGEGGDVRVGGEGPARRRLWRDGRGVDQGESA